MEATSIGNTKEEPTTRELREIDSGRIEKAMTTIGQKKPVPILKFFQGIRARKKPNQESRLMNLPAELRNNIYDFALEEQHQALLAHRPRRATLRPRTRVDPTRRLFYGNARSRDNTRYRRDNRPYAGLTQVCRQLRSDFFPLYHEHQEIALNIRDMNKYVETFFNPSMLTAEQSDPNKTDRPYKGNLTIGLGDQITEDEKEGLEFWPFLVVWANSAMIQAGIGRYSASRHTPRPAGEAEDL
jgi:hypothetical protein